MYMESHSCDVEKYVGLLVHSEKYFEIVHANEFTKVSLIHTSRVICKLDGFKVGIGFSILWMVFCHKNSSKLLIFINFKLL